MGFHSKARVTKSRSIARVVAPPAPQIFSPTGASLITHGGQVVAGGITAKPTGAQLIVKGGTPVYGGINARPTGASLVIRGATPGLSPNLIGSLVAWYDASKVVGLNDNDPVASLSDLSGSGYTLTASGTNRPTYKVAIQNGLPVLRFDGVNTLMANASFGSYGQPFTMWLIMKHTSTPVANQALLMADSFAGLQVTHNFGDPKFAITTSGGLLNSATGYNGAFRLFLGVANGGTNSVMAVDGTEVTGNAGTGTLANTLHLASDAGAGQRADMDFCEGGIASVAWDAGQRAAIVAYARSKWATP